jgi:hypothetical protein
MVAYSDVVRRHAGYATALFAVVTLAQFTLCLTVVLSTVLAGVRWDMKTPIAFSLLVGASGPLAAALCVQLSHDTWWYAHGLSVVGVPLWLCPLHGLFAHWVIDAYFLVSLSDVRKTTLP